MNLSKRIVLIAVFASFTAIADSIPRIPQFESGVWYSWVFMLVPIIGLILNPLEAFSSVLIGVFVGHYIYFRGPYEFLFALGSPIGAAMVSLLSQKKNKVTNTLLYTVFNRLFLNTDINGLTIMGNVGCLSSIHYTPNNSSTKD